MRNGKIIAARLWPKFGGDIPSITPVILGVNPAKYETIGIYLTKNSDAPNILQQKGKKVFYVSQGPRLPFFKPLAFLKLAAILKNEGVDILHCHKHKAAVYGAIAGRLAKVPIILAHVHGMGRTRNFQRKLLNYFIFPKVDKILAVGQAVKNDVLKSNPSVKPEKVINVGNSIDYDYFASSAHDKQITRRKYGIPEGCFVFTTAGRLVPTKGQQYLIRAFARVRKQLTNAQLLIAGTGELKDELEKLALELGCSSSVHFAGRVNNMPEFYGCGDIFVLSSIAEGLPRSLIEAMAAGVLCIAGNAGGVSEILDSGRFGLLVPPKDSNALADAMLKAVNMPQNQKETIISAAKTHIRANYNHIAMIKKMEKIYDALAAEKKIGENMNVRPKYPLFLPVFLRKGWLVSRKINALVPKLLSQQQINQLDSVEGHTKLRQCAVLFYLAYTAAKTSGRIVEIGSFKGKSTCWMAKALQAVNSNEKIAAIDPHINTRDLSVVPHYKEESSFDAFLNNLKNCGVTQYVQPLKQTSEDAAKNWNQPIKLLFIDGSHRYEDVMLDLKLWEPHLNTGGTIVMHDTKPTGPRVEVRQAMNDYIVKSGRFKELLQLENMACFTKIK